MAHANQFNGSPAVECHQSYAANVALSPATHFMPLDRSPYHNAVLAQSDPYRAHIEAFLADVTLPVTPTPFIDAKVRLLPGYQQQKKDMREGRYDLTVTEIEEGVREKVKERLDELRITKPMIAMRGAAQELYERYLRIVDKGYGCADTYFFNRAAELHEKMQKYALDWIENPSKSVMPDRLGEKTEDDVKQILEEVRIMTSMKRDDPKYKTGSNVYVEVQLPSPVELVMGGHWYREAFTLTIDKDDKIVHISIDELWHNSSCSKFDELAESYLAGQPVSQAQIYLLSKRGLLPGVQVSDEGIPKSIVHGIDELKTNDDGLSPLSIFGRMLDPELKEKLAGKSTQGGGMPVSSIVRGSLCIGVRLHDYGSYELGTNIDTSELTQTQIDNLMGTYVDILKAFPRIPKVTKE